MNCLVERKYIVLSWNKQIKLMKMVKLTLFLIVCGLRCGERGVRGGWHGKYKDVIDI